MGTISSLEEKPLTSARLTAGNKLPVVTEKPILETGMLMHTKLSDSVQRSHSPVRSPDPRWARVLPGPAPTLKALPPSPLPENSVLDGHCPLMAQVPLGFRL